MPRRIVAWVVTGPVGHLTAGVTDWAELLGRWWWSRLKSRFRRLG
jgi:hypothetical protein